VAEVINPKDIYKCAVMHNVLPFALNPNDLSWCGIAFPLGHRDEMVQTVAKFV